MPQFAGTAAPRPDPAVQARVEAFIVEQYATGRSLRELAELTDRSFSAVRNILTKRGVRRRSAGAAAVHAGAVSPETAGDWPTEPPMMSAPDG
jgi:hypothetical protein